MSKVIYIVHHTRSGIITIIRNNWYHFLREEITVEELKAIGNLEERKKRAWCRITSNFQFNFLNIHIWYGKKY